MEIVKLGDVLKYEQPTKYIVNSTQYNNDFDTPVLTAGKSFLLGYTDEADGIFKDIPVIIFDDFTTAIKFVDFPFKVKSSAMKILKPNKDIADIRFLFYRLMKIKINSSQHKRYWISKYSQLEIPLPPLPEQKRIAAILDQADKICQLNKKLIKKYEALTQSLFLDMFGDPVTNPKEWEKSSTINFCDCIVPGRDKPKTFTGDIPWVTTNDLYHLNITNKSKDEVGLTKSEIAEVRAKIIPVNSVIMTCVGDLGVVSVNSQEMVVNQQLHTFQCSEKLNPIFLMYNLSYQTPYMNKMASSTTVPYMNKTIANNTPTILPPITLQNQFTERINEIVKQKIQAEKSLALADDLFNTLLQKAFKGEL